jgi:hypothetical protein
MRASAVFAAVTVAMVPRAVLAEQELIWRGQKLRVTSTEATTFGPSWTLELQDRCTTTARKQEVSVPCSTWRPLESEDAPRALAFEGEITLPNGKNTRLQPIQGQAPHVFHGLIVRVEGALDGLPEDGWTLSPQPGAPGTWGLEADTIGAILLGVEDPRVPLTLTLSAVHSVGEVSWAEGPQATVETLDGAKVASLAGPWSCAGLERWNLQGAVLDQGLNLAGLMAKLAELEPICGETAARTRALACEAEVAAARQALSTAGNSTAALAQLQRLDPLLTSCPEPGLTTARETADGLLIQVATQEGLDGLRAFIDGFTPQLGEAWRVRALALYLGALAPVLDERLEANAVEELPDLLDAHAGFLGEEHAALARRHVVEGAQARFEVLVDAESLDAMDAFVTRASPLMGAEWTRWAQTTREELAQAMACRMGSRALGGPMPSDDYQRAEPFGFPGFVRYTSDSQGRVKVLTLERDCCDEGTWGRCSRGGTWFEAATAGVAERWGSEPTRREEQASFWEGPVCTWMVQRYAEEGCDQLGVTVRSTRESTNPDDGFAAFFTTLQRALRDDDHDTLYASFQVPFRFTDGASFSTREEFEAALPQLLPREFRAELLELDPHIGGDSIAYTLPYRSPLGIGRIEAQRIDGAWRIVRIVLFA